MSAGQKVQTEARKIPFSAEELSRLMQLGIPLVGAQLAQISINTMDVLMIGWLSAEDLAAAVLAFNVYVVLWLTGLGIIQASAPLSAQAFGSGDLRYMRRVIRQTMWIALAFSAMSQVILNQTGPILLLLGQDPDLAERAETYMDALQWAFFPGLAMVCLRVFLATTGHTNFYFWATIFMAVINGFLNYGLIFGNFGMPRLELFGAGIASTISATCTLLLIVAYIVFHKKLKSHALFENFWRVDFQILKRLFLLGLPIGMTLLSEVGMFSIASIMMGWIGVEQLAAHAIVSQCAAVTFMIPLGLGQAAVVRVGMAAGRGDERGVGIAGWTAMAAGIATMCVSAAAFWFLPEFLISLYQEESNALSDRVLEIGVAFMAIAAIFQLVDGAQVVGQCALRGLNDTKVPMIYAIIGYWVIGLGFGYVIAFPIGIGGEGIWWGLAMGLAVVAVLLTVRFSRRESLNLMSNVENSG